LCEPLFRRSAPQPAVHGGKPVSLFVVRKHAWLRLKSERARLKAGTIFG
jgi:hypothetical protein